MRGFSIINKVLETGINMEAELTLTLDEMSLFSYSYEKDEGVR
jgi:hypothetical protein